MIDFTGVKVALIIRDQLLVIQRDDTPGLSFAGLWDFPGGAREKDEDPFVCMSREVMEELGITIRPESVIWQSQHPAMHDPNITAYFMVSKITDEDIQSIRFGDEGQGWKLISIEAFMKASDVVEPLKGRLQTYLDSRSTPGNKAASSATN
jgi:8-oxo-dGTP diphosphatase